jgi:phosphatidylglycerophosphatase A|tara:strand:+ start:99 stop:605 length:507 start_codon:yes stop_codon:yes gene_type:complete
MINIFEKVILTMFGIGFFKHIPGTIASFVTCLIFYFLWTLMGIKNLFPLAIIFLTIIFIYSVILINKHYKNNDSKEIVIDEFIGQSIPLLSIHISELQLKMQSLSFGVYYIEIWILLSFILFRFFDILKPFPINIIDQKMKNGLGVILDDIVAGILTTLLLYFILLWI